MNRIYKVIWNEALNCFTAVGEYAKARGKSSKSSVSANATINTTENLSSTSAFKLTAIGLGLMAAGLTMSPQVFAATGYQGGTGSGTAISDKSNRNGKCSIEANAIGDNAVAIGCNSEAGDDFTLIDRLNLNYLPRGDKPNTSSVAIGSGAVAREVGTAVGSQARAEGRSSVALGVAAYSTGNTSLAIGRQSAATADFAQALGNVSSATGQGSLAIGHSALASGKRGIAIGSTDFENSGNAGTIAGQNNVAYRATNQTKAEGQDSIAFGSGAQAIGNQSIAQGNLAEARGSQSIAQGTYAKATGNFSSAQGYFAEATESNSIAYGRDAKALGESSIAMGKGAQALYLESVAIGKGAIAKNGKAVSIGSENIANGDGAVAIGDPNIATGAGAVAIGKDNTAIGIGAIALGNESLANKDSNIALGNKAQATGNQSIAQGSHAEAVGSQSIAQGTYAKATGNFSSAQGYFAEATESNSIAYGRDAKALGENAIALGRGAIAGQSGNVALGNSSITAAQHIGNFSINNLQVAGLISGARTVSVGTVGAERQIQNVAPGVVDANSTDAINGSQLNATNNIVTTNTTNISNNTNAIAEGINFGNGTASNKFALGDFINVKGDSNITSTLTGDGVQLALADVVNIGTISPVQINGTNGTISGLTNTAFDPDNFTSGQAATEDQLSSLNTDLTNIGFNITADNKDLAPGETEDNVKLGETVNFTNTDGNLVATVSDNGINYDLADEITLTRVTTGNTVMNDDGISIIGGSLGNGNPVRLTADGLFNGGNTIKGVGDGRVDATSNQAINGTQLFNQGTGINSIIGGNTNYNPTTGTFTNSNIGGTGENNINDAIAGGIKFNVNNSLQRTFSLGEEIKINTDSNLTTTALPSGDGIKLALADIVNVGSGAIPVKIDGTARTISGLSNVTFNPATTYTGGQAATQEQLTAASGALTELGFNITADNKDLGPGEIEDNVKLGETVNFTNTDGNLVATVSDNGINYDLADEITVESVTIGNGTNNTKLTTDARGLSVNQSKIVDILDGNVTSTSQQAVNGRQLFSTAQSIANNLGGGSVVNTDGTVSTPVYQVNGRNQIGVEGAIVELDKGFDLKANGANTSTVKAGDTIDIGTAAGETNIEVAKNGNNIKFKLANNIDLNRVTTGNTVMDTGGITVTNPNRPDRTASLTSRGLIISNGPSVLRSGIDAGSRKITNVKAGSTEFDAVNFGQLEGQTSDITTKGLNFAGNDNINIHKDLGTQLKIVGSLNPLKTASAKNIRTVANDGQLEIQMADDLDVTSVTTGNTVMDNGGVSFINSGVKLNSAGFTITNTDSTKTVSLTSTGLNNGGNVITNVARGAELTDAVNVEQLNEVKQSAADANKGWKLSAQNNESTISTVKPSDTVDLNNSDNNITVSKTAESNDVTFNLSKDIAVDSVKTGNTTMDNSGLTIAGGPKFTKTSVDAGSNKITNVANGFIEVASKDAVNGGQLFEVLSTINTQTAVIAEMGAGLNFDADSGPVINKKAGSAPLTFKGGNNITTTSAGSSIKFDLNGNINVDSVTTGDTTVSTNGVVIAGGPSIIKAGIYAGNGDTAPSMTAAGINAAGTRITNVADGMQPRDAVNFGQLDAVNRNLGNSINELGYRIGEVEDDANAGISAAMAMSSLPQAYIIGKSMIGGGIATYNGESAVAIGFSKLSADGRWVMKLNGTADTQGNVGAAIGAGFHFD